MKIKELNEKIRRMEEDITPIPFGEKGKMGMPKENERYHLSGHRETITALAFHPI